MFLIDNVDLDDGDDDDDDVTILLILHGNCRKSSGWHSD